MHAADTACYMTSMYLPANAAGCTPHLPKSIFMKPPNFHQVYYTIKDFELTQDAIAFMK
jgi:hypothetical protein